MYHKGQALLKGLARAKKITGTTDDNRINWENFDAEKFIAEYTDMKDVLLKNKHKSIDLDNIWICELFHEGRKFEKSLEQVLDGIKLYKTGICFWKKRWEDKLMELMKISEDLRQFEQEVFEYQNVTIFSDQTNSMVSSNQMLRIIKHKESRAYDFISLRLSNIENKKVSYISLAVAIGVTIISALNYFCG